MIEGKGGKAESELPAALKHKHSKAHHIGKAFASAHGKDFQGGLEPVAPGPGTGPENNTTADEYGEV